MLGEMVTVWFSDSLVYPPVDPPRLKGATPARLSSAEVQLRALYGGLVDDECPRSPTRGALPHHEIADRRPWVGCPTRRRAG
jgi:hypothetical protein